LLIFLGILLNLIFSPLLAAAIDCPALAQVGYLVFYPFCHQLDWRSFHVHGIQLAVCARCTGIYLGLFLGAAFFMARPGPVPPAMLITVILAVALDGALNTIGLVLTPAPVRFFLGLGIGFYGGRLLGFSVHELEATLKEGKEKEWKTGNIT